MATANSQINQVRTRRVVPAESAIIHGEAAVGRAASQLVGTVRIGTPDGFGSYFLAPRLAELLGQPVVVDNKPGANGIIGMQEVQRSAPDGYTFMLAHVGAISIGVSIYPNMPFDPVDEFASISVAVTSPLVWVVTPTLPFTTMKEFIAKVQAEPGQWRYGLPASGSIPHLVVEDTKIRHKLDMPAVPYRSTPQSLLAVISGEVPVTCDSLGASAPHIAGGKLRALAITSKERSPPSNSRRASSAPWSAAMSTSWRRCCARCRPGCAPSTPPAPPRASTCRP